MLVLGEEGQEEDLTEPRAHRAIGVVDDPSHERYDAFLYLDENRALRPLYAEPRESGEVPETFPSGQ